MAQSRTDVSNDALGLLGDVPAFLSNVDTDTSKAAKVMRQYIDKARRATLRMFPWNFAIVRESLTLPTISGAANNGSGLIRVTRTAHGFSTGNRIGISSVAGTTEANGEWTITVIDANNFDLVGSTFVNAYVSGGYVSIAPDYGYRHRHALPSDWVRLIRFEEDSEGIDYQLEGTYIYTDESVITFRYVADLWPTNVTDYAGMDALYYQCLAHYLAWLACFTITESLALKKQVWEAYQSLMPRARNIDSTENPMKQIGAREWLDSRLQNSVRGFVRDPGT